MEDVLHVYALALPCKETHDEALEARKALGVGGPTRDPGPRKGGLDEVGCLVDTMLRGDAIEGVNGMADVRGVPGEKPPRLDVVVVASIGEDTGVVEQLSSQFLGGDAVFISEDHVAPDEARGGFNHSKVVELFEARSSADESQKGKPDPLFLEKIHALVDDQGRKLHTHIFRFVFNTRRYDAIKCRRFS